MVDHRDVGGQGQHRLRLAGFVRRFGTQRRLPMADGVPADGADQSAGQIRQPFDTGGLQHFQRGMGDFHDVTFGGNSHGHLSQPIRLAVIGTQLRHGVHAYEAVSAPRSPIFRGFQNEGAGSSTGETFIETDRRKRIGKQAAHNRNNAVAFVSQLVELLAIRPCRAPFECLHAAFAAHR